MAAATADRPRPGRHSALGDFHPFTSMSGLWFCATPLPGSAEDILPVGIGITVDPDEYVVWWGHPFHPEPKRRSVIQLLATDATEAVDLAALLSRSWKTQPEAASTST